MSPETQSKVRPAFEKLQNVFFPDVPQEAGVHHSQLRINESEFFDVHLYTNPEPSVGLIDCHLYQNDKPILEFQVVSGGTQSGLSYLESNAFDISFGGSPKVRLKGRIAIGNRGDRADLVGDAFDQKGFQALADHVADWVERVVKEGKVGEIPFGLTHSGQ